MRGRSPIRPAPDPKPVPREAWEEGAFTASQAADFLGTSVRTVFNRMTSGELPWNRFGRERRIPKSFCVDLLANAKPSSADRDDIP